MRFPHLFPGFVLVILASSASLPVAAQAAGQRTGAPAAAEYADGEVRKVDEVRFKAEQAGGRLVVTEVRPAK